ncbi:putative pilus system protein FilA [Acinetobacter beijerinckii]|uniref:DUF6160 domain-containing protein n=1 Tax=Acinetobacter beijerinckii CIP 110307 TaxID=1217648 RepID=N9FNV5_9GAMM|nr:DUF6160 family protein [Acinetobacter beijerinckii]ENW08995.1 hypothetical protein F933_00330 [Acinetobacter beijerinckii CIP 110307]
MKMFTKLALVSSMAISANAMAMQSMDDAALSAATGQDGINLGIGISKIEIEKVLIHDNDGLDSTLVGLGGTDTAGAIVIKGNATQTNGIVITPGTTTLPSHNLADITIDTDAGAGGGNTAFLNVAAQVSGLNIAIGEIGVSASGTAGTTNIRRGNDSANYNAILSGLTLKTGVTSANIQLGAAPQGAMIVLNTTMTGGLEITDLGILDNSTANAAASRPAGEIRIGSIKVADAGLTDLSVNAKVSVFGASATTGNGYLQVITGSGASTPKTDIYVSSVKLGSAAAGSIGDVEVQGMQTYYNVGAGDVAGTRITISGH